MQRRADSSALSHAVQPVRRSRWAGAEIGGELPTEKQQGNNIS